MSYNSAHIGEPDRGHAHFYSYYILYVYILNENFKPCVIKPVFFQLVLQYFVGAQFDICWEGFKRFVWTRACTNVLDITASA